MSENIDMDDLVVETSVAAEMIGVPARTLVRMVDRGRIKCVRTKSQGDKGGAGHRRFRVRDIKELRAKGAPEIDRANSGLTDEELAQTMTTAEVTKVLGVKYHTLRRWEADGIIESYPKTVHNRVRWIRSSVEALAEKQRQEQEQEEQE
jgi:predicted site-specific integrase-resolvase